MNHVIILKPQHTLWVLIFSFRIRVNLKKWNQMKNLKNIFLLSLVVISFGGCKKDLLITIPNDRISAEIFWKTDNDAIFAANAVYTKLENEWGFVHWDAMSDIGHVILQWRNESNIQSGIFDARYGIISSKWNEGYAGIQCANIFLDNVDKVETINQPLIDQLKSEVKVLRAYFYIRLALLYGDVPLVTSETSLEASKKLTRTPVAQVWDFISKELTDAAVVLPNTQKEKGRITKGAALAIKARAMLYAGRYPDAADAAKEVMDLNVYSLYPSYENLFSYAAENNQEVIFDRQYIKNSQYNNIFELTTPNSLWPMSCKFVPTKNVVDAYQMTNGKEITDPTSGFNPQYPYTNRDPRLKYTIITLGDTLPNDKIYNSIPGSFSVTNGITCTASRY